MKHTKTKAKQKGILLKGKIILILIISVIVFNKQGFGQLITEPFNYTPHATNGLALQSGGLWSELNSGDSILIASGNLNYTGLAASTGNSVTYGGAGADYQRTFTSQTSGTVYCSFLLNISSLGSLNSTGGYTLGFVDSTTSDFAATLWLRSSGTNFNIGINPRTTLANTVWLSNSLITGTTYLIVIANQIISSTTNDSVKIWLNPTSFGGSEPFRDASAVNTGTDLTSFQKVFLRQDVATTTPGVLILDEMRVGTTWASVTPSGNTTATLADITQPSGTITQGINNEVLAGFTVASTGSDNFTGVTVTGAGTATASDLTSVRIFRDNNGDGMINGSDASVSGAGMAYAASMAFTISGETGISSGRNYLIAANVAGNGLSTPGDSVAVSIAPGAFTTTAATNTGSATGNYLTIVASVIPLISLSGTLTQFTTVAGTPSTTQTYSVTGVNLTDDIIIIPPSPFEISLNGTTWIDNTDSIVLTQTGGIVTSTNISVRYNPSVPGTDSDSIYHKSSGATTLKAAVSGNALETEPGTHSAVTIGTITSTSMVINFSGGTGTSRIVVMKPTTAVNFAPSDGIASTGVSNNFASAIDQGGTGNRIVYDGSGNTVTVNGLSSSTHYYIAVYEYNGSAATANYNTTSPGTADSSTLAPGPVPVPMASQPGLTYTEDFTDIANWTNNFVSGIGASRWWGVPANATGTIPDGVKTTVSTTAFSTSSSSGGVQRGGLASSNNLAGTIVQLSTGTTNNTNSNAIDFFLDFTGVNAGTLSFDWAVVFNSSGDRPSSLKVYTSIDSVTFTELTPAAVYNKANNFAASGSITAVALPAYFNGVATARIRFYEYNDGITAGSSGSRAKISIDNVTVTAGTPTPPPTLQDSDISFSNITTNSMDVAWINGDGTSRIVKMNTANSFSTPGDGTSPSANNVYGGSGEQVIYNSTGSTVSVSGLSASTTYFFRVYAYNGSGTSTGYLTTAATLNPDSQATNAPAGPTITLTGTLSAFSTVAGTPSGSQSYHVEGLNLTDDIVIIPPSPFEISLDDTTWIDNTDSIVLSQVSGSVASTQIFVRYNPSSAGSNTGNITHTSNGATSQSEAVSGNASPIPGPVLYSVTGSQYSQNFDSLSLLSGTFNTTGLGAGPFFLSSTPLFATSITGWQFGKIAGTGPDAKFIIDDGSGTTASAYSYGTTNAVDRSLGSLAGGAITSNLGVLIKNTTSDILSTVTITYTGEQWRNGGSGIQNTLQFYYSLSGTSILNGTYTSIPSLLFISPVTGSTGGSLDGNASANRTTLSATFNLNGNWLPGQLLVLRWDDFKEGQSNDGLAIDDFYFTATGPSTPTQQDSTFSFSNITTVSLTADWLNGDGTNHLVLMNTVDSFSNPVDGNTYPANTVYAGSGEQVVYNGTASTVNITGLTAGTQYFFRVFGYNGNGAASMYLDTVATLNPDSVTTSPPSSATQLAILSVNGGNNPSVGLPFDVVVQAQDGSGSPQNLGLNTSVQLSVFSGIGSLSLGNISGVISAGTNSITITGVIYDMPDFFVQLEADYISGDTLAAGQSASFDVIDTATLLNFGTVPVSGVVNSIISPITVNAVRGDLTTDPNYTGQITISVNSGPGTISGTLTQTAVGGVATFNDIQFSDTGTYTLLATASGLTSTISGGIFITYAPALTELVVPQYIGCKTTSSTNTDRTPIAVCVQLENLTPNTLYDIRTGVDTSTAPATSYGGSNIWTGSAFSGNINSAAFTTDATGNSGPYWIFIQPATSRFEPGGTYNLRIGYIANGGIMPTSPNLIGTKIITALDDISTARTVTTADDGAFIKGTANVCAGGKFILVFDNLAGTGNPLYAYQSRQAIATNTSQGGLPSIINDVYTQSGTSVTGDFVAIIPVGANNPNGVRRIEARNADNSIFNFATDSDGIWPGGANTTTITRRSVAILTSGDANLNTSSVSANATPATCGGNSDGTAIALALGSGTINYSWNSNPVQTTSTAMNLPAGNYTVVVTDANNCTSSASTTVTQPAPISISGIVTNTNCLTSTGAVDITVNGGTGSFSYSWDNSATTEDISSLAAGDYTVTVTDSINCSATATFTVIATNPNSPLVITATPPSVCPGGSSTLIASGALTYSWSPSTGLSGTTGDTVVSTPASTITYNVTGDDGSGCLSTANVTVTVNSSAPVITPGGPTTFCDGGSVTLSAPSGGMNYTWTPNGETTQSISATTSGPYTVSVDYGAGCVLTSSVTNIVVNTFSFSGTIYSENMGSPSGTTLVNAFTGWQNSAPVTYQSTSAGQSDVRTTSASTTYPGASGGGNIFFTTSVPLDRNIVISGINTLGYSGITLTFGLRRDAGSATDLFVVEYSTDGISYSPMTITQPVTNGTWGLVTATGVIPATGNLRLRFSKNSSASFRLDDVKLTSSTSVVSVSPTGPVNLCPGASAYLTSNIPSSNLWSPGGATTKSIVVTTAGSFTVTAIGNNGCAGTSAPVMVQNVTNPVVSVTPTDVSCNGNADGSITSMVTNGTSPYSYSWNSTPVQNSPTATLLSGGTYTVTVTDANGCLGSASASVINPPVISVSATQGDTITCNGGSGTVTVTASGGTGILSDTGLFNVSAGNYTYTVTDANGCTGTASITISEPPAILISNLSPSSGCPGSVVVITGSHLLDVTGVLFNDTSSSFTVISDNEIDATVPANATSGIISLINSGGCTGESATAFTVTACSSGLTLNMKMFIEGFYSGGGLMQNGYDALANNVGCLNTAFVNLSPDPTDVDTIRVTLMDAVTYQPVETAFGILKTDGDVTFNFSSSAGSYFLMVQHRNTIETWSAAPVAMSGTTSYDFTDSASAAFGGNETDIGTPFGDAPTYAMYSGDITDGGNALGGIPGLQDGIVESADYGDMENAVYFTFTGYAEADVTGDGIVESADYGLMENAVYFTRVVMRP